MKRARRFPQRLVRWTSLCVCFALVLSCLAIVPFASVTGKSRHGRGSSPTVTEGAAGSGQGRRVDARPPQPGPPAGTLPNLDEMRRATDDARRNGARAVRAPQPIPSTQRRWRHVQPAIRAATDSKSPAVKANHFRGISPTVREGSEANKRFAPAALNADRMSALPARSALAEPQGTSDMAMARIDPHNRMGTGGVDLLSNNFNWSLGLVGLKGRGLDLGLSLAYNSLATWTQSGNYVAFDMDQGDPSPGFRLGFPAVQGPYYNNLAGVYFYILILPSGQHVELRQISTYVYQGVDASYSQLTVNGSMIFRAGGAQLTFNPNPTNTEYHCTEVKDRNGNFLTINYAGGDDISTVTDTLGRVVTFNYDGNGNIQSITQPWNGQTHQWATFGWGTTPIGSNFSSSMSYAGPTPGTSIPVITWVGLPDGSKYYFDYDGSYGAVTKTRYYAYSGNERRQTTHVYAFSNSDSPRVTSERDWAASWNGDTDETPASGEEAVTTFSHDSGACVMTAPDGTIYKEFYGSGWQSGLTTGEEFWSGGVKKKWTSTTWTQDNTSVSYLLNPRVTETNIYDSEGNHKRTVIDYSNSTYAAYSLPYVVLEYADGTNLLRSTWYDYNLSQQYLDRRIIGLVMWVHVVDPQAGTYVAKTTYGYDESSINSQATTATQHDQSYSSSFNARANVTSVSRWDVTDINNGNKAHTSQMSYDAAGSVLTSTDALNHQSTIEYSASFAYAYPTLIKDPDWNASTAPYNYSTLQYNSDTGAVTQTQGPPPAGQSTGAIQNMAYDSVGRLQWITRPDGFWKYIAYADRGDAVMSQVSLTAYPDSAWSITVVDGAGRTRLVGKDLPNSTGGYAGAFTHYDNMGRVSEQSNVEETNAYWSPAGDDLAGWVFPPYPAVYDWKGRPTRTYNTDGTYKEASYGGCGCAGGEVVTLTDEVGRRQKVYSDSLGRQWKTEVLNWDGSVYSTTENTFNARDQVTLVRQFQGPDTSGVYQDTTMTFDGYGRLQTKHVPEQNSGTATTYTYNNDDTVNSVTDARGAAATYGYNGRHLVTGISYSAPAGITPTAPVSFGYDAAGNRTSMSDGLGSESYSYDQLSRLTSESRSLNSLGTYALSYQYNLAGELTNITDPSDASINYSHDSVGRLSGVTGSGYGSFTQFASSFQYRAWGGLKHLGYGNNLNLDQQYNSRLQITRYALTPTVYLPNGQVSRAQDYQYYADGRISFSHDEDDNKFDRSYSYDHAARLTQALTGYQARGEQYGPLSPYQETFSYDGWGNTTDRFTNNWGYQSGMQGYKVNGQWLSTGPIVYQNNRSPNYSYDSDGRVLATSISYDYDARGSRISAAKGTSHIVTHSFDGDGQWLKEGETITSGQQTTTTTTYSIRSSVLGGATIETVNSQGTKNLEYVYTSSGIELAKGTAETTMIFVHRDPVNTAEQLSWTNALDSGRTEMDPLGGDAGVSPPEFDDPGRDFPRNFGNLTEPANLCTIDRLPSDCNSMLLTLQGEAATVRYFRSWQEVAQSQNPQAFPLIANHYVEDYSKSHGTVDLEHNTVNTFADDGGFIEIDGDSISSSITLRPTLALVPQNRVPLAGDLGKRVADAYKALGMLLGSGSLSDDCKRNVIDKLTNAKLANKDGSEFTFSFNDGEFADYIAAGGNFYDGIASNDKVIAVEGARAHAYGYATALTATFDPNSIRNASTSGLLALLFHEALHGFGDNRQAKYPGVNKTYSDRRLQEAFGLPQDADNTFNISKYIQEHCFPE